MIDLAAEVVQALRSDGGREALRVALAPVVAEELRRALAEQAEQLEPLSAVLGVSAKAASARLAREPELRKIGVQVGARCLFKRADVTAYYKTKAAR